VRLLSLNPCNIKFAPEKIRERWESNPGRLGGKRERYLCGMPTPLGCQFFTYETMKVFSPLLNEGGVI